MTLQAESFVLEKNSENFHCATSQDGKIHPDFCFYILQLGLIKQYYTSAPLRVS